ncbi:MAG: nicotinate (nicotinamide) nucleotide adenylyltransferase [Aquificaceae bacterium]
MNLIFFGGSFDPIHIGHLITARDVAEGLRVEKVVFIPASQSPLKESHKADPKDRLTMLTLAIGGEPLFEFSKMEIERGGISYTVDTARELLGLLGKKPTFLVGADSILTLHMWKEPYELVKMATFVIADREEKAEEVERYIRENFPHLKPGKDLIILRTRNVDVSSTEIRKRLKEGKSIKWLVPEKVEEYILERKLYII